MDIVSAASTLRDQIIVLDIAHKQKELLEERITSLSQQSLISSIDGNSAKSVQLSLRLSVCEGVQQIYQQISDKKLNQVQTTARSILSELSNTDMTASTQGTSTGTDKTAASWSRSFCDFYRDN